ncbi:hypothetical protein M2105_003127 [Paenibacillus sp. PastF-1]|nr:hypothetical protein [Paenibacillus sp. PastF-2]MDF9848701.1 hypothetical protein [Paenibacillus sp. PastM-2]MDF9855270.1 hypothetical protein [Paenibacillus sp. PastF-1]MDH6480541.1 hypothetical protein [Paenibacillus sp. PastH-2]
MSRYVQLGSSENEDAFHHGKLFSIGIEHDPVQTGYIL